MLPRFQSPPINLDLTPYLYNAGGRGHGVDAAIISITS